jgi:ABC-2 type transport system permease protein
VSAELHAEWTKFRTLTGNWWLLVAVVAGTVGISVAAVAFTHVSGFAPGGDATKVSLSGVYFGQLLVAALAVTAISEEYATGMIRMTLGAMPRRLKVLMAKSANLAGLTTLAGVIAAAGCVAIGRLMLPGDGLGPAHGYALISIGSATTIRAAGGTAIYLALIALLSLGVATLIRDTAVSIGIVVGLLYLPALLAQIVGGSLGRHIKEFAPMSAGTAIQATTHLTAMPIQPWAGLAVLAGWAAASLLLAATSLCLRDA